MKKKEKPQRPMWLQVLRNVVFVIGNALLLVLKILGTVTLVAVIAGLVFVAYLSDYLKTDVIPEAQAAAKSQTLSLDSISLDQTSFIMYYDKATGKEMQLQEIDAVENRVWASYDEIPQDLVHAAIAIEDKRFPEHKGVDWVTFTRACVGMAFGTSSAGGSTLTQQLIKNLTGNDEITIHRKVLEVFTALEVEKLYSKKEIMEWYLNTIYLGERCYGVKTAAEVYFGKPLSELTTAECASLISITNNPSLFDPYIRPENNRERQLLVLEQMKAQNYITQAQYDAAVAQQMDFHSSDDEEETFTCANCGFVGTRDDFVEHPEEERWYCPKCEALTDIQPESDCYSYFVDTVIRDVIDDLVAEYGYSESVASQKLTTAGLTIYSTIDVDAQRQVDQVYENMENVPGTTSDQTLQSAIVVIDNASGDIVAMSGGVGKKEGSLTLNRATMSTRQPGSTIKPIAVYAPALDLGLINPGTIISDSPYDTDSGWPKNYNWIYSGNTTVTRAVVESMNTVAVKVMAQMTVEQGFNYATNRFGLSTLVENIVINGTDLTDRALAPLALGAMTYGVTVRDMTQAYAAIANKGVFREARTYTKVVDSNGKVVLDNTQESHVAVSERAAWYMTNMMQAVVQQGTGYEAQLDNVSVAAKTGTTSDDNDRWFAAFTPYYTAVVWSGFDYAEEITLTDIDSNPSLLRWREVMERLHKGLEERYFDWADGASTITICVDSGKIATENCKNVYMQDAYYFGSTPTGDFTEKNRTSRVVLFSDDVESRKVCDMHEKKELCMESNKLATDYCRKFAAVEGAKLKIEEKVVTVKDQDGKELKLEECDVHTKQAWEEYEKTLKPTEPTPDDTKPTEQPTEPTQPDTPVVE